MEYTYIELKNENWKDIDGYDGAYQVSDLGRVRSHKSGEWKVMRPSKDRLGYLKVCLRKDGKQKTVLVHRLVAQAFIPNDDESKTVINHKNDIPSQNFVNNLEWCTQQYNVTYNDLNWRRKNGKRRKIAKLYDPDLSIADNLDIFRANGIECDEKTVRNLRKDLGLTKKHKFRNELKDLYDQNLSSKENIEIFKANGIECCRQTVLRLRKDLGLIDHKTKLDKIKPLYRPDLTYNENLDIFKANGVECSRRVIKELRKDLGLIK